MDSLVCSRCGASLRAEDGSARLRCEYCGEERRLGADVLAVAHEYRKDVSEEVSRAAEQALIARQYAHLAGGEAPGAVAAFSSVSGTVCRACGAPTSFAVGAMVSHCGHCGASLLASEDTRERGLDEAARAVRGARLEALKHERRFATGLGKKYNFFRIYAAISIIAIPAVAAVLMAQSTTQPDAELQALGFAGMSLLAVAIVAVIHLVRRSHRERADGAVRGLIARYQGRALHGVDAIGGWMNTWWCDAYDVYDLSASFDAHAAACTVRGYPALAVVHPLRSSGTPFVELLLSVWYDGRSETGEGPATRGDSDARRFVNAQGFELRSGPSGLHARMRGDPCRKRLKTGIDFEQTLAAMARVAETQGGRPAPA